MRILYVEDNDDIRESTAEMLRREGYEVATAALGSIGLRVMREMLPDLVIIDWMMPEMDGATFAAKVRADPALADIPLVAHSAYPEKQVTAEALHIPFVRKPNIELLLSTVAAYAKETAP